MRSLIHSTLYWSKIIALGIILGIGIQFAHAWTNPTLPPPGGNVSGPLNTGIVSQIKQSSLGLLGNLAANMLQINEVVTENTACSPTGLVARDSGGVLLSCQGGLWKKATGGGVRVCKAQDLCGRVYDTAYDAVCLGYGALTVSGTPGEGGTPSVLASTPIIGKAKFVRGYASGGTGDTWAIVLTRDGSASLSDACTAGVILF